MQVAMLHAAHDLRIERQEPVEPGPGEVRVRIGAGGICGSDLHYFHEGRVGDFALREPMVLGHEAAGTVERLGPGAEGLQVGQRVALNPSRPCLHCAFCRTGRSNLCRHMRFLGSAAVMPHVQGAFAELHVARADQCVPVPDGMSLRIAACAEPLAVALHAVRRAGDVLGRRVIVAGAGPIGTLCVMAARRAGAAEVCVTDLQDAPLGVARATGGSESINIGAQPERLAAHEADKGRFDAAIEATGAPPALRQLFRLVRPGGRIVQLGMLPPGEVPLPANLLMAKEIDYVGAFRFHEEFGLAVDALASGAIDVAPILSAAFPLARAAEAFALAGDRSRAMKVHLTL